jgi:hypothetical protein
MTEGNVSRRCLEEERHENAGAPGHENNSLKNGGQVEGKGRGGTKK